jgi:hypothetical protein
MSLIRLIRINKIQKFGTETKIMGYYLDRLTHRCSRYVPIREGVGLVHLYIQQIKLYCQK